MNSSLRQICLFHYIFVFFLQFIDFSFASFFVFFWWDLPVISDWSFCSFSFFKGISAKELDQEWFSWFPTSRKDIFLHDRHESRNNWTDIFAASRTEGHGFGLQPNLPFSCLPCWVVFIGQNTYGHVQSVGRVQSVVVITLWHFNTWYDYLTISCHIRIASATVGSMSAPASVVRRLWFKICLVMVVIYIWNIESSSLEKNWSENGQIDTNMAS